MLNLDEQKEMSAENELWFNKSLVKRVSGRRKLFAAWWPDAGVGGEGTASVQTMSTAQPLITLKLSPWNDEPTDSNITNGVLTPFACFIAVMHM